MMSNKLYLLLLLGVAGSLLQVAAEDGEVTKDADDEAGDAAVDDEEEEEDDEDEEVDLADLEGEGGGDEGIATVSVFTEGSESSMPAGAVVSALVGFSNGGNRPLVVKAIRASIRDLNDFNYIYENYTAFEVGATVEAGEQASYMYEFTPGKGLDPRDVAMEIAVDYVDDDDEDFETDAAFNGTVTITAFNGAFDMDQIVQLIFFAVVGIGGAWYLTNSEVGGKVTAMATGGALETGPESSAADDDWTTAASPGLKQKKGKGKGKK